jgi:hypothetical protein
VDVNSVDLALEIQTHVKFQSEVELPLYISGNVSIGNKVIARISDLNFTNSNPFKLQMKHQAQINQMSANGGRMDNYFPKMYAPLSSKAVEHIENVREKHPEKSVMLHFDITIKFLLMPTIIDNRQIHVNDVQLEFQTKTEHLEHIIGHSDWINKFTKPLGIGNFMLLEFTIPEKRVVDTEWEELYEKLYERTEEMELAIRKGEWKQVMVAARQFYENIKIGDKKSNHVPLEEKLKLLFMEEQHSEEGFQNLMNGISNFFDFASKYIHDKSRTQRIQPTPLYTKEDSYFIFSLSIGLLNMIAKKIEMADSRS